MGVRTVNFTIPASGVLNLESANFLFILSSTGNLTLQLQGRAPGGKNGVGGSNSGANETLNAVPAGVRIQRLQGWGTLNMTGAVGVTGQLFYGFEQPREDATDFQTTIATISGSVVVVPGTGSANALTNHADVVVATTTLDTTIAANGARKYLIIGSKSTNAPGAGLSLRVQGGAGVAAAQGMELQPGTNYSFPAASAFAIYNPAAVPQTYWWLEGS